MACGTAQTPHRTVADGGVWQRPRRIRRAHAQRREDDVPHVSARCQCGVRRRQHTTLPSSCRREHGHACVCGLCVRCRRPAQPHFGAVVSITCMHMRRNGGGWRCRHPFAGGRPVQRVLRCIHHGSRTLQAQFGGMLGRGCRVGLSGQEPRCGSVSTPRRDNNNPRGQPWSVRTAHSKRFGTTVTAAPRHNDPRVCGKLVTLQCVDTTLTVPVLLTATTGVQQPPLRRC